MRICRSILTLAIVGAQFIASIELPASLAFVAHRSDTVAAASESFRFEAIPPLSATVTWFPRLLEDVATHSATCRLLGAAVRTANAVTGFVVFTAGIGTGWSQTETNTNAAGTIGPLLAIAVITAFALGGWLFWRFAWPRFNRWQERRYLDAPGPRIRSTNRYMFYLIPGLLAIVMGFVVVTLAINDLRQGREIFGRKPSISTVGHNRPEFPDELIRHLRSADRSQRVAAGRILGEWATRSPEDIRDRLQASGIIATPENVLPKTRDSRSSVGVIIVDRSENGDMVAKVLTSHLDSDVFVPIFHMSLADENSLQEIIDAHPETTFIVNESQGDMDPDPALVNGKWKPDWILSMGQRGVIFVFATGNRHRLGIYTHPAFDNVLYVSATGATGQSKASEATFGMPGFVFAAPASPSLPGIDPQKLAGTSFTAPQVAGILADTLAKETDLPETRAIERLRQILVPLIKDPWFSRGLLGGGRLPLATPAVPPAVRPRGSMSPAKPFRWAA